MPDLLKIITAALIWGTVGVVSRQINIPAPALSFWRSAFGAVFVAFILIYTKQFKQKLPPKFGVLVISGFCLGSCWGFLFLSYQFGTVALATLLCYCAPLFVILLSPLMLNESISKLAIGGCALIALGLWFTACENLSGGLSQQKAILFGLLSALCYSAIPLLTKRHHVRGDLFSTFFQLLFASVVMIPFAFFTHSSLSLPSGEALFWLLVLGFVHTGTGLFLWFSSLNTLSAQQASLWCYLEPVTAIFWSYLILGESLTKFQFFGSMLILLPPITLELQRQQAKKIGEKKRNR